MTLYREVIPLQWAMLVYFDSSGKVLANSLVAVDNIVTNTGGSVTSGNLPIFSGMGGRQIADSFIPSADLVKNSTGSTVVDQVATYSDTTGKNITNSNCSKTRNPSQWCVNELYWITNCNRRWWTWYECRYNVRHLFEFKHPYRTDETAPVVIWCFRPNPILLVQHNVDN